MSMSETMHDIELPKEQPVSQQIAELKQRIRDLEDIPVDKKVPVLIDSVLAAQQVAAAVRNHDKSDSESPELSKSSSCPMTRCTHSHLR